MNEKMNNSGEMVKTGTRMMYERTDLRDTKEVRAGVSDASQALAEVFTDDGSDHPGKDHDQSMLARMVC